MYKIKQIPEDFIVEEIPKFKLEESGEYGYFLLEKKDYDTEKVIQKISEIFKINRKNFGYAGNKDRNAITKQYFSIKGKIKDLDFGNFKTKLLGFGDKPLSLGDLKGNKFSIIVRNIEEKPKKIDFTINYFDDQRFGKYNLEIGLSLIKKDFKKAAELIDLEEAKAHLAGNKNDFVGAIKKVPFKILNLYLHAVQSWLWNEVASTYVKEKSKKYSEVKYRKGKFIFTEEKIEDIEIPLISFDTESTNKEIKNIYNEILSKNFILERDFIIRAIPDISPRGGKRRLISKIKKLNFGKLEEDELNKGKKKIRVDFELDKGCYATILIKSMFSDA